MTKSFGFKVVDKIAGRHGGELFVAQAEASWADVQLKKRYAIVTDVRIHESNLSAACAAYFGYQVLDRKKRVFTMPTISELNLAIENFNRFLPVGSDDQILIKYHNVRAIHAPEMSYVERFANDFELPISLNGQQLFHDTIGHGLQGFYLPNRLVKDLKQKADIWRDFRSHPMGQGRSKLEEDVLEVYDHGIISRLVFLIDSSSNFLFNFVPYRSKRRMQRENQTLLRRYDEVGAGLPTEMMPPTYHQASLREVFDSMFEASRAHPEFPRTPIETRFRQFVRDELGRSQGARPFDLSADLDKVNAIMANVDLDHVGRLKRLARVPYAKPFVNRVRHLRKLVGIKPL